MKRKSILALMLAMAMTMGSALTVLAAESTADEDTTGTEITGEGEVEYVNTKVISVTLPTTASLKLTIDPQGLSALANGATASKEDLANAAGLITGASKAVVTNCSSVPVKVSVKLTGTGNATFVTAADDVEKAPAGENKEQNILLYALPSSVDVENSADKYVASTTGVTISTTEATVNFVLDAAQYNYSKNDSGKASYTLKDGETGHGTAISFEGLVNTKADWSDYIKETSPSTIGMTAVFTYTSTLAETDVADTTEGAPYGMMAMASGTITVEAKNAAPVFTASTSTPGLINYTAGAGELGLDKDVDIQVWHEYTDQWYDAASDVEIGASTITYKEGALASFAALGDDFKVQITYTNGKAETKSVDLVVKAK